MKTVFRDIKYYNGTTWIHFVLLLLVVVFDMQVTAQSETTIESVIVPTPTCKTVWRRSPYCDEFNECTGDVITPKCGQNCTDTSDSFVCSCNAGYRLSSDRRTCDDINECNEKPSNCAQNCSNTPGSYTCSCNAGYRLAANGRSCNDINECTDGSSGCMPKNSSYCFNTDGSYTCSCQTGYRLAADGKLCNDVDECADFVDNCTVPENSICKNNLGSYQCVCKTGFEQVGTQCHDINECETLANNCTLYENTTCVNTIGSYKCRPNDRGISEAAKVAIPVTLCLVAVLVVIVIAVVCFVRRAKERKGNEKGPAKNNAVTVASANEHVYVNQAFDSAKGDSSSGKTDSKDAATGNTILTNVHKGIQRIFKFKKANKDLQSGETTNESVYQDLVRVSGVDGVYEVIKKKSPKAKKVSVQ